MQLLLVDGNTAYGDYNLPSGTIFSCKTKVVANNDLFHTALMVSIQLLIKYNLPTVSIVTLDGEELGLTCVKLRL